MEKYVAKSNAVSLLAVLEILKEYSDADHLLTQEDIAAHLEKEYGIVLERKAISRRLDALEEADYELVRSSVGCYLVRPCDFEDAELRLLIDSVMASRHISAKHSKDLVSRLAGLSNRFFESRVKNVYAVGEWNKTESQLLFLNMELIDEAIAKKKKVRYDYNKYDIDGKLHKTHTYTVSPYQMILHNQRYYLMAHHDTWDDVSFQRLDHMTNMEILDEPARQLRTVKGYENGIDYKSLGSARPYMYADEPQLVELIAQPNIVDQIVDWFGRDVKMVKQSDGTVKVTLKASSNAMEHWAMQYVNYVEVVSPKALRDRVRDNILAAAEKYR